MKNQKGGKKCQGKTLQKSIGGELSKGLSTLDIMHLGGWEDLSMVLRYTRGITFEDCIQHYREVV